MKRRRRSGPSPRDVAEVAGGRGSSADKKELHGYALRHPNSAAAKALKRIGYKPRRKKRKKR